MKSALLKSAVILFTIILIISSGCTGTQTTDIVLGGNTVGKIYVTPNSDALMSNSSLTDMFDVKAELLGFEFSKEGVTSKEADEIIDRFSSGDAAGALKMMDFEFKNDFVTFNPSSPEEFFDEIINMPFSNHQSELPQINFNEAAPNIQYSADRIAYLISKIFS